MLGLGLLVALPFALLLFLPPRMAANLGTAVAVLAGLGTGYAMCSIFGFGLGTVLAAGFVWFVAQTFTGLFILMRMQARGEAPPDTIRLI